MLHKKWDILLTPMTPNSAGIMRRKLFEDHYVTFFDPEYQDAPNSIEAFAFMPHAVQSFQGNHYTNVDEALDRAGFSREKRLIVANFEHLPAMMRGTPLITTLPSRFKDDLFREFAYAKTPIELPDMSLYMCWSEARGHSAAHIWLREYLASIAVK